MRGKSREPGGCRLGPLETLPEAEREGVRSNGTCPETAPQKIEQAHANRHSLEPGLPFDVRVPASEDERVESKAPGHERSRAGIRDEERRGVRVDLPGEPIRPQNEVRRPDQTEEDEHRGNGDGENRPAESSASRGVSQPSILTVTRRALSSPVCSVRRTRDPTTTPGSIARAVSFASRATEWVFFSPVMTSIFLPGS